MGNKDKILDFLKKSNIQNTKEIQLEKLFVLLKDKDFFKKLVSLLKDNLIFDEMTWSFSIYHGESEEFEEYL